MADASVTRLVTGGLATALPPAWVAQPDLDDNVPAAITLAFVDAYRGAGRPEATYVIERAMDLFAAEIGMDRAELRRRNFVQPDQFPYENPSGLFTASGGAKISMDSGNYEPAMDKALEMAGYANRVWQKTNT